MNHIKWLSLVALVIAALSLVSCASKQAKDSTDEGESFESPVPPADQQAFERGMSHLEREEYELALEEFDRIIESNPSSEFHLVTLFNRGAALEGMGKCSESTKAYRQTLRLANKRYRRIEAQALFRLAYTYECLGDIPKQIASLRDAMRRRKFLSQEISAAELPARLAAAYARTGNLKTAEKYFAEAQKGLMLVHTEAGDPLQRKELLARTLFLWDGFSRMLTEYLACRMPTLAVSSSYRPICLRAPKWSLKSGRQELLRIWLRPTGLSGWHWKNHLNLTVILRTRR